MKWILRIALILSLGINGYFIVDELQYYRNQEFMKVMNRTMGGEVNGTTWKQGLDLFKSKLIKSNKALLNKKYYYINVWTSWCKPCIKEMPWLDSIAGKANKDVAYFFVSEMSDDSADKCIKKRNYAIKNFIFLNDMNDFVSAICNMKDTKNKVYPMVLILSNTGELLHFSNGAYSSVNEAAGFAEMIDKLK
jgi:thiol-disulfide isomerase/thioredoxin